MTTLTQLRNSFLNYFRQYQTTVNNEFDSTFVDVDGFLNDSYHSIIRDYRLATEDATVSLLSGQYIYDLDDIIPPSGIAIDINVVSAYSETLGEQAAIPERQFENVQGFHTSVISPTEGALPYCWGWKRVATNSLVIYPAPDSSSNVLHINWFVDDPNDLQSTLQTTYIPESFFVFVAKKAVYSALLANAAETSQVFYETQVKPELENLAAYSASLNRPLR